MDKAMSRFGEMLDRHAFGVLFIEALGWDRFTASLSTFVGDTALELTGIAQKKGVVVFLCRTERTVLANRGLLRQIQRALRKRYHEHILITVCETPRKQVWQWATLGADGHHVVHREHPFFSHAPPPRLLERLRRLNISIDEEEQIGLTDVLAKIRVALSPVNELNLFAKWPKVAAKSDRLAMALKRGEPGAFQRFVELHLPLARRYAKRLHHWFPIDAEDAEQTAVIGLLEAARRFDPERGFLFSTYARFWLREVCQRHGLDGAFLMRVPALVFWACYRFEFRFQEIICAGPASEWRAIVAAELESEGIGYQRWENACAARNLALTCELSSNQRQVLRSIPTEPIMRELERRETARMTAEKLDKMNPRLAQVLRLRYGMGCSPHTLTQIAEILSVTRERVRQLQMRAEQQLARALGVVHAKDRSRRESDHSLSETEENKPDDPA
jgi:RNA polymerase sigma factor (sigma-70 family)